MSETGEKPLRYNEEGNVHLDFHGATNTTIDFIVARYGVAALHEIFTRVGRDVYADLRRHLEAGDRDELVRHWRHFFSREHADFDIEITEEEVVLTVRRCPAWHHVEKIVGSVSPHFCDQTSITNAAMAAGSPFEIETRPSGGGSCVQVIRRRV